MNILFLIGNGFDLNLGLKTSYRDFYNYYQTVNSKVDFVKQLKKDISGDLRNWSDLELALGDYTEKINSREEFDEIIRDIRTNLAEYLEKQEAEFDFSKLKGIKLLEGLSYPEKFLLSADYKKISSFRNKWKNHQWNVNVFTFNYTRSIENIIDDKQRINPIGTHNKLSIALKSIEHIHGYTNDRMVLGVNDIKQIKNESLCSDLDITESLIKPQCNQAQKHSIDNLLMQRINVADLICIFGSSIGDTDTLWWELIGEQLKRECHLMIFEKCEEIIQRDEHMKGREERRVKKHFLSKTNLKEDERKKYQKNIYVGINCDIFNMN